MVNHQQTLSGTVTLSGVGLHTGREVRMELRPAEAGSGVTFVREDLDGHPRIPAVADVVLDSERNTTLSGAEGVCVRTPEHLLAALWLTGVDNADVALWGEEVPIVDGSAGPFVEAILRVGVTEQAAEREYIRVSEPISFTDPERDVELTVMPYGGFRIDVMIDYDSEVVGYQYASFSEGDEYAQGLARSRTFVFLHELEQLWEHNLIRGGALDNAIVVVERPLSQDELDRLAGLMGCESVSVSPRGYLSAEPLRYTNELARHKLLDILGDLTLVGRRLRGRILARRPGHKANTSLAKLIRREYLVGGSKAPQIDLTSAPVLDIVGIQGRLPHRPPFLLIDKVMALTEDMVVGVKNVTMNEPFFVGHFPGAPVMPGVLQIEAMAQVGGILVLGTVPDPENWLTYFLRIDNARFRQQVVPGDTLVFRCKLQGPIRRGLANMRCEAFVGKTLVSEADLMAQIIRRA